MRLGGVEVRVGGRAAPLFYAGPNQVNFQTPGRLPRNQLVRLLEAGEERGLGLLVPHNAPALFPVAIHQNGSRNSPSNAVARNGALTLYGTGVRPAISPPDGEAAPASGRPLLPTPAIPYAWVGHARAPVLYSGLAPGLVGVWQVNIIVPADAPVFSTVPVRLLYDGIETNSIPVAVR